LRHGGASSLRIAAFVLPLLLMAGFTILAYLQLSAPGELVVQAKALDMHASRRGQYIELSVRATVEGLTRATPFSLKLTPGTYLVSFEPLPWYRQLNPQVSVSLPAGATAYAIGLYEPIARVIAITEAGFNVTKVTALHAVTPVIWINAVGNVSVLNVQPYGRVVLLPGQNFTWVFDEPGTYLYYLLFSPSVSGSVEVV
jgi:hypothetical protein